MSGFASVINPYSASATPAAQSMASMNGGGYGGWADGAYIADSSESAPAAATVAGMPLTWWVGALVLLALLKFAGEHENSKINPAHVHVGGYNLAVLLMAWIVAWTFVKLVVNRWFGGSSVATFTNWLGGASN